MAKSKNGTTATQADEVSIAWHKMDIMTSLELAEEDDRHAQAQVLAQALATGVADKEMVRELMTLRDPKTQREHLIKRMDVFAKYVENLPRDWFVEDAPSDLDFDDPKTYQHLRTDKFKRLYQMLSFNGPGEDVTGN